MDQPASLASLVLAVAARRGVPVAYVPGLVMRRAADLYPGEAKTDRRDAFVLAGTGRTRSHQVHWLDGADHALLAQLRVLNGDDDDLAADATRLSNRLVTALFPPPWSAFRAPDCTIRASATSSPAIPCPKRWPFPFRAGRTAPARNGSAAIRPARGSPATTRVSKPGPRSS